ncbi:MAG: hypothetical protein P8P74_01255, partial [Crocinitomicaceae bacterium]|nr:hypothetical protein [Crocinitomicaceae bacterium]
RVITKLGATNDRLAYDKFEIDNIGLNINTGAFALQGVIAIKNDDPVFGDLFYGSISLKLNNFMDGPILVSAGFGKLPAYKYWFTDASLATDIELGTSVKLTSIYGGVQRRVQSTLTDSEQLARVAGIGMNPSQNGVIPFVPDQNQGLVFRAGVGLENEAEEMLNAEVMLTVAFNPSGGFQSINLSGQAYSMVTRAERADPNAKKIYGIVNINYDNAQKVFHATLNGTIYYPNTLSGNLDITLHADQNDWYFWLNRPTNRANVNLMSGLFYANAYFMVGTQIDPIPSPPNYITNAFAASAFTPVDFSATATGGGFALGVETGATINKEFPQNTPWRAYVNVQVALGFDLMMMNASNYHCSGSSEPVGMNGYYCQGQVYSYLNGSLGLRKYKNGVRQATHPVGGLQVAAILQGKFPKPTYMYGALVVHVNVLGIYNDSFMVDVEYGTNCTLVTN